jgi:hypothetical protein
MVSYQVDSKLQSAVPAALVVHCGDHRFQAAFQEFLNRHLGLAGNYDLLVIPGGPQSLTLVEYLPKFSWATWRWFRFFVENHEISRLILIQHQDCAWYKTLPLHLHSASEPRQRQEEDLRKLGQALRKDFPQLKVELYFAAWNGDEQGNVEFLPLEK